MYRVSHLFAITPSLTRIFSKSTYFWTWYSRLKSLLEIEIWPNLCMFIIVFSNPNQRRFRGNFPFTRERPRGLFSRFFDDVIDFLIFWFSDFLMTRGAHDYVVTSQLFWRPEKQRFLARVWPSKKSVLLFSMGVWPSKKRCTLIHSPILLKLVRNKTDSTIVWLSLVESACISRI